MNRDELIEALYEAGVIPPGYGGTENQFRAFHRFADIVAAAEREACAKVCQEWLHGDWHLQGVVAAMMIRERGEA